ncbi:hypothetical protein BI350_13290 [Sporosarcina ureilytica]|uniref:GGDEF domain-containing protein n=1 Tax=Sporosarcina ureilytica TaxID=298596 RepID=A0A1D8JKL4_9BACL|nr:hypothetical protein BI350_13290 [Sporosarcina ureilytica]
MQKKVTDCQRELFIVELRILQDLHEERQVRTEFEHKYTSVIDDNLDPIISINEKLNIVKANVSVRKAFGYHRNELEGSSLLSIIEKSQIEQLKETLACGFTGTSTEMEDIYFIHKNGSHIPTHMKVLPVVVEGIVTEIHLIIRDFSVHHYNHKKLLFLSYHDQLTGLWNRKALRENFEIGTHLEKLAFIHLDLDRFKLINDSIGQIGGDEILKRIGERLKSICPENSQLYRNGGDEFIILIRKTTVENTKKLAEKLLHEFDKPFYYKHQEYFISVSIGISMYPKDGNTLGELIRKSEQALSYVKGEGRAHFRFYETDMDSLYLNEVVMESHLRRAIELNELKVYYQPQIDLRTGQISSFEALLRWNNKKFGFVSPGQFIPLAEKSGIIHSVGEWVLDNVCRQLKEWQDKRYRKVRIAVNISPNELKMEDFSMKVKQKIKEYGISPSSLEVEITENALANMEDTLETLNELKKIGVSISIDDFGTGYSSLSYLKQYPIDTIKIDRSFIQDIESDEKNKAIALTIINLAHNLGMDVIAEGVEKDLQAAILLNANCQKAQGFLYSKAIPVDEINEKYFTK